VQHSTIRATQAAITAMVLSTKQLSRLGAKARRVPPDEAAIQAGRRAIVALIDEFWIYYRNPSEYAAVEDPAAAVPRYVSGIWTRSEPLIAHGLEGVSVRIPYGGRYLPLTADGREEILLAAPTGSELEELLASIKHAVSIGRADKFLLALGQHAPLPLPAP